MSNTKISYLYRDASNYKITTGIILKGEITETQKKAIMDSLDEGEYFIPEQIGLIHPMFSDGWTEDDHCFCELNSDDFSICEDEPTEELSIEELVDRFVKAGKDGWDSVTYAIVA